jgi:predicted dehydrogenase
LRKEWLLRAAAARKHIVCEKPCGVSVADLREILDACREHQVQFMDGVMFMHSRRLERVREVLDDPATLGPLRRISSAFSFCGDDAFFAGNIRSQARLEPDGCVGDLGWYCLRFALWVMREQLPVRVTGRRLAGHPAAGTGTVPAEFSGELFFPGGVTADYYCSFVTADQQWAQVAGANGWLRIPDFVLPFFAPQAAFETHQARFEVKGCEFRMLSGRRDFSVPESSNGLPDSQEANLFRNFADQVRSGRLNEAWPTMALNTQRVMEACLRSAREGSRPVGMDE